MALVWSHPSGERDLQRVAGAAGSGQRDSGAAGKTIDQRDLSGTAPGYRRVWQRDYATRSKAQAAQSFAYATHGLRLETIDDFLGRLLQGVGGVFSSVLPAPAATDTHSATAPRSPSHEYSQNPLKTGKIPENNLNENCGVFEIFIKTCNGN